MLKNVFDLFYKVGYTLHVGVPHARGKPRAQDDVVTRRVHVRFLTIPPSFSGEKATSLCTKEALNGQISVTKNSSHLPRGNHSITIPDLKRDAVVAR